MGWLDRLFGRRDDPRVEQRTPAPAAGGQVGAVSDEQALERYRYMVQTAPPEMIEQAHQEAFARLTPAQRAEVLQRLAAVTPEPERAAIAAGQDDPKTLARLATRAEIRQPGVLERTFGGPSMGGMMAGTIFGSLVAGFLGSMIAHQFFESMQGADVAAGGLGEQDLGGQAADTMADDFGDVGDLGGDI